MGSLSVTCHPAQVNVPRLNPRHAGWYSIYLPRRDGRLSWPSWLDSPRPGVEPATFRSQTNRTAAPPRQPFTTKATMKIEIDIISTTSFLLVNFPILFCSLNLRKLFARKKIRVLSVTLNNASDCQANTLLSDLLGGLIGYRANGLGLGLGWGWALGSDIAC